MPDCMTCANAHSTMNTYSGIRCIYEKNAQSVYGGTCVNGSKFKQSQPIRLYKVEVTNDKRHTKQGCNVR